MEQSATYVEYPAFRQRLDALRAARVQAFDDLEEQEFDMAKEEYRTRRDVIKQRYDELVAAAHREFNVPVLTNWQQALQQTGQAIYHQEHEPFRGMQVAAMLTRDDDGGMTLSYQQTYRIPCELEYQMSGHLDRLGCYGATWERMAREIPAEPELHALQSDLKAALKSGAMISHRADGLRYMFVLTEERPIEEVTDPQGVLTILNAKSSEAAMIAILLDLPPVGWRAGGTEEAIRAFFEENDGDGAANATNDLCGETKKSDSPQSL
jgi:hypothetical protein